jgi:co-chaperonin GroES (HSP10)
VIDAGPNVKHGIKKGAVVLVDSAFTERKYSKFPTDDPDSEDDFICDDRYVYGVYINRKIFPLGKRILIRRLNGAKMHGDIVAAAEAQESTDQSLEGVITQFGILPRTVNRRGKPPRWQVDVGIGDHIMLHRWSEKWTEVGMDGIHYIIVEEKDLLYRYE